MVAYNRQVVKNISNILDKEIKAGNTRFVIYPYGEFGRLTEKILREVYTLEPVYMIDNKIYDGHKVLNMEQAKERNNEGISFLICNANPESYEETRKIIYSVVNSKQVVDVFPKNEFSFPPRAVILQRLEELNSLIENIGV